MEKSLSLNKANVAVIGAGLMGGSILKALSASENPPKSITAYDIDKKVLEKIESLSIVDVATDDAVLALKDADLIVISLYPAQTIEFVKNNAKHLKSKCVVTDICGIKREVMEAIPNLLAEDICYVGGHPMAGREHKGFDYSKADLFARCKYIVDEKDIKGKDLVVEFARALGAGKIVESSGTNHDEMIAYTSQLPHVLAVAYMLCAGTRNVEEFSAGSFRDVTRVAMINDEMWSELFCQNSDMLIDEIVCLRKGLLNLEKSIKDKDTKKLRELMRKAATMREDVME